MTGRLYPLQMMITSIFGVIILSCITNELFNNLSHQTVDDQNVFGFLPKLDENGNSIEGTELILISRGYLIVGCVALTFAIIRCFTTSSKPGRNPATIFSVTMGVIAVISLLIGITLSTPLEFWSLFFTGRFSEMKTPQGENKEIGAIFFYASILIYSACNMPMAMPEVVNSHKRANLPLAFAMTCSMLVKWLIGMLGGIAIVNYTGQEWTAVYQAAMIGIGLYCAFWVLP